MPLRWWSGLNSAVLTQLHISRHCMCRWKNVTKLHSTRAKLQMEDVLYHCSIFLLTRLRGVDCADLLGRAVSFGAPPSPSAGVCLPHRLTERLGHRLSTTSLSPSPTTSSSPSSPSSLLLLLLLLDTLHLGISSSPPLSLNLLLLKLLRQFL